jgi:hypothetical protein
VLAAIVMVDPALYAGLGTLVPLEYRFLVPGVLRFDQVVTLAIALLSLGAAVQRSRGYGKALRWTAVASYALLFVPSMVGLIPFGYWFLRVRKLERRPEVRST